MLLPIMIPAVLDRLGSALLAELHRQQQNSGIGEHVEILALYDNRRRSTGRKRQVLLDIAQGNFVTCLDDDDGIATNYLAKVVAAILQNPATDVIVFNSLTSLNNETPFQVITGLEYENEQCRKDESGHWVDIHRKPWTWCIWSSRLGKSACFPDGYIDDDWYWLRQIIPQAKTQFRLNEVLHYYQYNSKTSFSNQGKPTCA